MQVPDDSIQINGNTLTINLQNVAVTDNFFFFGPGTVPATASFSITYSSLGSPREIEARSDPIGPFRWEGSMSHSTNSGTFSVAYDDGSFSASGSFSSTGLFGEMGTEKNGVYVHDDSSHPSTNAEDGSDFADRSPLAGLTWYVPRARQRGRVASR